MPTSRVGPDGPAHPEPAHPDTGRLPLSRRRLLVTIGAVTVIGSMPSCGFGGDPDPDPSDLPTPTPTVDPDEPRRAAASAAAEQLALVTAATIAAHPDLAALLGPLVADHRAHLEALDPTTTTPTPTVSTAPTGTSTAAPSSGASGEASGTASPTGSRPPVPPDPAAAQAALATAEQVASAAARTDAVGAVDPALARLLASIAASRALHVSALQAS